MKWSDRLRLYEAVEEKSRPSIASSLVAQPRRPVAHRVGAPAHQTASSAVTYASPHRSGCRLRVPDDLMRPTSGTVTLEQYRRDAS